MEFAVLNRSTKLSNADVCYLVEAVARQVVEFCTAWNVATPAVAFYATDIGLPADDIIVCTYVDQLDVPDAIAYHTTDPAGRPVCFMLPPGDPLDATDLGHEILETITDPTADRWEKMPNGSETAVESVDAVQSKFYQQDATVLGETRSVKVTDYLCPRWFGATDSGPFDRTGDVSAPFTLAAGGYMVVLSADGTETNVFGDRAAAAEKLHDPGSRMNRRLTGARRAA